MGNGLTDADAAAVREVWEAMQVANMATDWDGYMEHLTKDHVALDPRIKGVVRGVAALREWVDSADLSDPDASFTVEEIGGSGDVAYLVFTFRGSWMEAGKQMEARGKGLSLFQRGSDGTWLMSHQAWNLDP